MKFLWFAFALLYAQVSFAVGHTSPIDCYPDQGDDPPNKYAAPYYYDWDGDGALEKEPLLYLCPQEMDDLPQGHGLTPKESGDGADEWSWDCSPGNASDYAWVEAYGTDADGDGYPAVVQPMTHICTHFADDTLSAYDMKGQGSSPVADCNDNDFNVPEGFVWLDSDGDGFPDSTSMVYDCRSPELQGKSYVPVFEKTTTNGRPNWAYRLTPAEDCAPMDPSVHGGKAFYPDLDHDGFGSGQPIFLCGAVLNSPDSFHPPEGYADKNGDCNDSDPSLTNNCKMYFDTDRFYDNSEKVKYLVSHPFVGIQPDEPARNLDINLRDLLVFDGPDKDSVEYSVDCFFCANSTIYDGVFHADILATTEDDFKEFGGKQTIVIKAVSPISAQQTSATLSMFVVTGEVVIFINGINTDEYEFGRKDDCDYKERFGTNCNGGAVGGMHKIERLMRPSMSGLYQSYSYLSFDTAHNPSRLLGVQDIAECVGQYAAETGIQITDSFMEAFYSALKFNDSSDLQSQYPEFYDKYRLKVASVIEDALVASLANSIDAEPIYRKIEENLKIGKRVLLVSHSQGNLFSNQVFGAIDKNMSDKLVRQVQVATPALSNFDNHSERYITASQDKIIRYIPNTRPANGDVSCDEDKHHNFIGCYLDENNTADGTIINRLSEMMIEASKEMSNP